MGEVIIINLRKSSVVLLLVLSMGMFSGCSIASVFSDASSAIAGRYFYYNGTRVKSVALEVGQSLDLSYSLGVNRGTLALAILDPGGKTVWEEEFEADAQSTYTYEATEAGTHKLVLTASGTGGRYQIDWETTE